MYGLDDELESGRQPENPSPSPVSHHYNSGVIGSHGLAWLFIKLRGWGFMSFCSHWVTSLASILDFWDRGSSQSPCSPWTGDPFTDPPKCWGYRHAVPCLAFLGLLLFCFWKRLVYHPSTLFQIVTNGSCKRHKAGRGKTWRRTLETPILALASARLVCIY